MTTLNDAEHALEKAVADALKRIPADDRDTWIRMGMACHSAGEHLFGTWNDWSQTSDKYDERAAETVWRSFKFGTITIASLFKTARDHGWQGTNYEIDPEQARTNRAERMQKKLRQTMERRAKFADWWETAGRHAKLGVSPYLKRKGITQVAPSMLLPGDFSEEMLTVVPYVRRQWYGEWDEWQQTCGAQLITADGHKHSMRNSWMSDAFTSIYVGREYNPAWGRTPTIICEGYATMHALECAVVNLDPRPTVIGVGMASNLERVGHRLKNAIYEEWKPLIVCDNDEPTKECADTLGTGIRKVGVSEYYAQKSGAPFFLPPTRKPGDDFADLWVEDPKAARGWLVNLLKGNFG